MRKPFFLLTIAILALALAPALQADVDRYYGIEMLDQVVGYMHFVSAESHGKWTCTTEFRIELTFAGEQKSISRRIVAVTDELVGRALTMVMESDQMGELSYIEYDIGADVINKTLTQAGTTTESKIQIPEDAIIVAGDGLSNWDAYAAALGAKEYPYTFVTFVPLFDVFASATLEELGSETLTLDGIERDTEVYRLKSDIETVKFWVDRNTREVIQMHAVGQDIRFFLSDASICEKVKSADILAKIFTLVDLQVSDPTALDRIELDITARIIMEPPSEEVLNTPYQEFEGSIDDTVVTGTFTMEKFTYDGADAPEFPYTAPDDMAEYVAAEPFIESDDEAIAAKTKELVAECKTSWDAASAIGNWVFENITYTLTGASAKQAFESKKGDCGPHTRLAVAMCRAAGIPARMVGGALYTQALGGSYGQHYWVEAYMGSDGWIPFDPTSGEIGTFGAGHLTLFRTGGIGKLEIEVVGYTAAESEPAPEIATSPPKKRPLTVYGQEGYHGVYIMTLDDQEIGRQSFKITDASDGKITFTEHLVLKVETPAVDAVLDGTCVLTETASPISYDLKAVVNEGKQAVSCEFGDNAAKSTITLGESPISRETKLKPDCYMGTNNMVSQWSAICQSLSFEKDSVFTVPVYIVDAFTVLDVTFRVEDSEEVEVDGTMHAAWRVKVEPLGENFFLDKKTGEVIYITSDKKDLKIVFSREN